MESLWILLGGGFIFGCWHALDADHVCTITGLILERHSLRKTFFLALRWSLGHSLTLILLAGFLFSMKTTFASVGLSAAQQLVGLSMIFLGFWLVHREWHRSLTPEAAAEHHHSRFSGWFLFGMGILHGTAGSSSMFLLIPIALTSNFLAVLAYVALFSMGMILTMGLYAALVNRVSWIDRLSGQLGRMRYVSAVLAMIVGLRLLWQSIE